MLCIIGWSCRNGRYFCKLLLRLIHLSPDRIKSQRQTDRFVLLCDAHGSFHFGRSATNTAKKLPECVVWKRSTKQRCLSWPRTVKLFSVLHENIAVSRPLMFFALFGYGSDQWEMYIDTKDRNHTVWEELMWLFEVVYCKATKIKSTLEDPFARIRRSSSHLREGSWSVGVSHVSVNFASGISELFPFVSFQGGFATGTDGTIQFE